MSDYYNRNRKKKRSRREKIGFYTACSICLIAVCMAVYSTYNTLSVPSAKTPTATQSNEVKVNENVTGVTQTLPDAKLDVEVPTIAATEEPATNPTESTKTALETMLSTDLSLNYPLNSNNVVREYSEKSVYFKTLNVWKPHTGVDFGGKLGDDVTAMTGGVVTKVCEDKMLGKIVEISTDNVVCRYCGLGSADVSKGDSVDVGKKIGTIGAVPFEAGDENHIHIEVKIDGKYADPVSFINNNE